MICILCNEKITSDPTGWDGGHNAQPVAKGRCCGDCNDRVVLVARLEQVGFGKEKAMGIAASIADQVAGLKYQDKRS